MQETLSRGECFLAIDSCHDCGRTPGTCRVEGSRHFRPRTVRAPAFPQKKKSPNPLRSGDRGTEKNFGQRRIVRSCPHRRRVVSCIRLTVGIAAPVYFPDLFRCFSLSSAIIFGEIHAIGIPSSISSLRANFFISILHCAGFSIRTGFKVVKRFRLRFASHSRVHRISVCTPSFRWYGQAVLGPCRLRRRLTPPRFPRWHEEDRPRG